MRWPVTGSGTFGKCRCARPVEPSCQCQEGTIDEATIERGEAVWLTITLDTELYAPRTYAAVGDNRRLAERNGPRLTAFLKRLETDLFSSILDC